MGFGLDFALFAPFSTVFTRVLSLTTAADSRWGYHAGRALVRMGAPTIALDSRACAKTPTQREWQQCTPLCPPRGIVEASPRALGVMMISQVGLWDLIGVATMSRRSTHLVDQDPCEKLGAAPGRTDTRNSRQRKSAPPPTNLTGMPNSVVSTCAYLSHSSAVGVEAKATKKLSRYRDVA